VSEMLAMFVAELDDLVDPRLRYGLDTDDPDRVVGAPVVGRAHRVSLAHPGRRSEDCVRLIVRCWRDSIPHVEKSTVTRAEAAARWYSETVGLQVRVDDLVQDDLEAGVCSAQADTGLCLRQSLHADDHLPAHHIDSTGHVWRLVATFELDRS